MAISEWNLLMVHNTSALHAALPVKGRSWRVNLPFSLLVVLSLSMACWDFLPAVLHHEDLYVWEIPMHSCNSSTPHSQIPEFHRTCSIQLFGVKGTSPSTEKYYSLYLYFVSKLYPSMQDQHNSMWQRGQKPVVLRH